jgi:hypothetical protein
MKAPWIVFALLSAALLPPVAAAPVTLVENGRAASVIVVPDGKRAQAAASALRSYIEKATGARLEIIEERRLAPAGRTASRIFVGPCEAAKPVVDLATLQPEGFVIKTSGGDVYIVGQDIAAGGREVEGTFYGVCEFLERFVGVRWLMPGPHGEVVPKQLTLRVDAIALRQEPVFWQRRIREVRTSGHRSDMIRIVGGWGVPVAEWQATFAPEVMNPWFRHQRLGSRVRVNAGHAYGGWWDKYHEKHPDIFALQPNGTRINSSVRERLCVSNPTLWELVAREKIAELRADPTLTAASIGPNDGGGGNKFCSCQTCRSWDGPEAQAMYQENPRLNPGPGGVGPFPPLSDRYFRYYNEVAKRVKREMPDRYLGVYAYSLYRRPPTRIDRLEDNLIVSYVAPNSMVNDRMREEARRDFAVWSTKATQMLMRPNFLAQPVGLPVLYVHKLADDIRFFTERGMRITDYASCFGNWGTQGLNYYVLAKLLWDPYQDVDAMVEDYCRAAYGRGAAAARDYYRRLEELTNRIAAASPPDPVDNTTTDFYTDEVLARLRAPLAEAVSAIGSSDPAARERVGMLERGLDYARATRRLMRAAADVREGKATREHFLQVEAEVMPLYQALALDFAVASEQNYRKVRMGLGLAAARRAVAADADEP